MNFWKDMRLCIIVTILLAANLCFAAPKNSPPNWYNNFIFKNDSFVFEFIRTLGYAYSGGADLGESVSTALAIKDGDIKSWYQQWSKLAAQMYATAQDMEEVGNKVSAREAYFRASNYYRTAGLYSVAVADRQKSIMTYGVSKSSFQKAAAINTAIKLISIPYENTTLPGYFIAARKKNAPLIIIHTGFDGTAEELYFESGYAARKRGYNVLMFEGPGQGSVLRQQNLPFRYDWEHVVTPVINYALKMPDVEFDKDKIALMGISMGGYLAARACAFDERIKACILNGGVYDMSASIQKVFPPEMLEVMNTDPEQFNVEVRNIMRKNLITQWFFNNAMWAFATPTPYDVINTLKEYTLKDVVKKISAPTLVIDSEADVFFSGQPQQVYAELQSPKTLLKFTREEAAEAHCQMGAIAISNEKIYDWLDKTFKETKVIG